MYVYLKLIHESVHLDINIENTDKETLTQISWEDLFKSAQKNNVPYYMISTAVVHNGKQYVAYSYDGLTLQKQLEVSGNQKDPHTNLSIIKTYHTFFRCFEFSDSNIKSLPFKAVVLPSQSIFDLDRFLTDDDKRNILGGLNFFAAENDEETKVIGRCQFLVGADLLHKPFEPHADWRLEGLHWMWCASQSGIREAHRFLAMEYMSGLNLDFNKQKVIEHFQEAIARGDGPSLVLLNRLDRLLEKKRE